MALVKCGECGKSVSTTAERCPHCGAKPEEFKKGMPTKAKAIIALLAGIALLSGLSPSEKTNATPQSKSTAPRDTTPRYTNFTEEDFYWDKKTKEYKDLIVHMVNEIHRKNPKCMTIDPATAAMSSTKGTASDPVFFVTCGEGINAFNVFFSKSEANRGVIPTAPTNIDQATAVRLCEEYAKANATHPSTVKFSRVMSLSVTEHANGNTTVLSTFTAKNSFGLELKYDIRCLLNSNGIIEGSIVEA